MKDETRFNILKYLLSLLVAFFGAALIWKYSNGWVIIGVILLIWSNNLQRTKYPKE